MDNPFTRSGILRADWRWDHFHLFCCQHRPRIYSMDRHILLLLLIAVAKQVFFKLFMSACNTRQHVD